MKDHYVVSVIRVPSVSRERMRQYIHEAVSIWAGSFRPSQISHWPTGYEMEGELDPLGPPCPLMEKGAVTMKMVPRGAKPFAIK